MKRETWNHNFAYHKWILKHVKGKKRILDVGCGDGTLVYKISNKRNYVVGIDIYSKALAKARQNNYYDNSKFIENDFLSHDFKKEKFDVIIFVASLHHMDMEMALLKAKRILNRNGIILVVGLAKPSNFFDYVLDAIRVVPSAIVSKIKKIKTSEDLNIVVNYDFPKMICVRIFCKKNLKKYSLKYGLHYRYLLYWKKQVK